MVNIHALKAEGRMGVGRSRIRRQQKSLGLSINLSEGGGLSSVDLSSYCWLETTLKGKSTREFCLGDLVDHVIQPFSAWSLASLLFLYLSVNWLGLYTKYLTERAQRKAFLETRRSLETRLVLSVDQALP